MRRRALLTTALLALSLAPMAPAQSADELTVEVIVFAWTERPPGQSVDPAALPGPGQVLVAGTGAYTALGETALTLRTARDRLAGARQTTPLVHLAWRQTPSDGRWVQLDGNAEGLTLSGRVRLEGSRNPELALELVLTDADGQRWLLRQQRGIRAGATEYFDHPGVAAIVRTTPYASLVNDADL